MYFQLEFDYYSNEANRNKYKNFQLIVLKKPNLNIAEEQIVQALHLQRQLDILCCLDLLLLESLFSKCKLCFFEQDISCSIFISMQYQIHISNTLSFIMLVLSFVIHKYGGITLTWHYCNQP